MAHARERRLPRNASLIVGLMIVALIIGGGIVILSLYPTTDKTSFYVALAAIVLSPIFLAAAFLVNKKQQTK
jgi:heme A synthase